MNGSDSPPKRAASWVSVEMISIISVVAGILALGAALLMYLRGGDSAPLIGAIGLLLAKFSTVCDYWLGSSSGSQKKDAVIAAQLPPAPADPPK